MKLINRDTDYAVQAILYIAKKTPELVSTGEVEAKLGLPRPFIRKIFQALTKEGYLSSIKGSKGGFNLAVPIDDIQLLDIMKLFQGRLAFTECSFQKNICPNVANCPLRKRVKSIEDTVVQQLQGVYLKDMLND